MKPETDFPLSTLAPPSGGLRRATVAVAIAVAAILAIYFGTAASVVAIWNRAETFTHGYVVVPIALWLIWRNRAVLAGVPIEPFWWGLVAVAGFGAVWLLASTSGVLGVEQFALLFMIEAAVVTIVGLPFARAIAFPLFFLVFAVPFGEIFVPKLIDWTADFTVLALRATGVPVYREGNHFNIPSGAWSVVEACSGIRYLIASLMVGILYAHVTYRSAWRRAAFILASILVPIVANWLRAYMIVMLGHLSNNRIAVGVDHLIYGWIFFGVVIMLMFWIGSYWREEQPPAAAERHAAPPLQALPGREWPGVLVVAAVAAVVAAGVWRPIGAVVDARLDGAPTPRLPSVAAASAWTPLPTPPGNFKPHYLGARTELEQGFAKDGLEVGVYVGYYAAQKQGEEMISSANVLATPAETKWKLLSEGRESVPWNREPAAADSALLGAADLRIDVLRIYWVAGHVTASEYAAKAWLAYSKLTGQGDDSAVIVVYAPRRAGQAPSVEFLRGFVADHSPAIERMLAAVRGRQ